jgi:hypothetical protein
MKILVVLGVMFLLGCPAGEEPQISAQCTEVAARCRLAPGQLGVCTMNQQQQTLFCAPQH